MSNDTLCSFCNVTTCGRDETMISIVNVMLGISEAERDVNIALKDGPTNFLSYLSGTALAHAIADALCARAEFGRSSLPVESEDVEVLIKHYLEARFHTSSTARIGVHGAYNFQRLVYNTCACVVAHFQAKINASSCECRKAHVASLRRATAMAAEFSEALKHWLPVSPWVGVWWTRWHVLAYVLEMTSGTVLCDKPAEPHALAFLVFCDTVIENVLREWDDASSQSVTDYRSSSFAWCACSKAWQSTLRQSRLLSSSEWTPNAFTFLTVANNVFNPPMVPVEYHSRPGSPITRDSPLRYRKEESRGLKRKYESPVSVKTAAARTSARGVESVDAVKRFIAL